MSDQNLQGAGASSPALLGSEAYKSAAIIYGYPQSSVHGKEILQTVKEAIGGMGASVEVIDLYSMKFNPVLSDEESVNYGKSASPEAQAMQKILSAADVWYFIYPVWWGVPPAIMKGFIDRVLTPGFAFKYSAKEIVGMLQSKRALIIRTFGSSAKDEQEGGNVTKLWMEGAVLETCGIKAQAIDIYSVNALAQSAFRHALFQISGAARRAMVRPSAVPHQLRTVPAPYLPPINYAPPAISEGPAQIAKEEHKLSAEAQDDLEYFRSAKRVAVRAVHEKAKKINSHLKAQEAFDEKRARKDALRQRIEQGSAYRPSDRDSSDKLAIRYGKHHKFRQTQNYIPGKAGQSYSSASQSRGQQGQNYSQGRQGQQNRSGAGYSQGRQGSYPSREAPSYGMQKNERSLGDFVSLSSRGGGSYTGRAGNPREEKAFYQNSKKHKHGKHGRR